MQIDFRRFEFVQTLCSVKTLKLLDMVKVDQIKVASRDLTNIPLIEALAKRPEPIILSTGMANENDLQTKKAWDQFQGGFFVGACGSAGFAFICLSSIPTFTAG